ncbi:AraC family transcriptional regulator [Nocardia heshunensis]
MLENTISSRLAALAVETASQSGVAPAQLASALAMDRSALTDDLVRVPTATAWRVWELVYASAGPVAGVRAAAIATHGRLNVWDYLFSSGATLGESLRTVVGMRAVLADPHGRGEVLESGGLLTVRDVAAVDPGPIMGIVEEFTLSLMLQRARLATGQHLVPVRVRLRHRAPTNHRYLVDVFGTGRIDFGAPYSEIVFLDVAALPIAGDPHLGRIHRHYAELLLGAAKPAPSPHDRVRAAIRDALRDGDADLGTVARRLIVSPRSLQRQLHERGTTWRDEIAAIRHEQATNLLRETDLPLQSIAARLGYTDPRSFRRAFHRHTGQSPTDFRRRPQEA